jgi:hypothetical protein
VVDAVAGKDLDRAIVELDREVHDQLALGDPQDIPYSRAEVERVRRDVKLSLSDCPRIFHSCLLIEAQTALFHDCLIIAPIAAQRGKELCTQG